MKNSRGVSTTDLKSAMDNLKDISDQAIKSRIGNLKQNLAILKGNTVKIILLSEAKRIDRTIEILGMVLDYRSKGTTKV